MPHSTPHFGATRRFGPWAAVLLLLVGLTGCEQDQITRYKVDKDPPLPKQASPTQGPPRRMVAAMISHADQVYFFKLLGPPGVVAHNRTAFDEFLQSVRFTDRTKDPLAFKAPEGWSPQGASANRLETFAISDEDEAAEMTITALDQRAAAVLPNVNRWRGQLGLPPITATELGKSALEMKTDAGTFTIVDLSSAPPADEEVPARRPAAERPPAAERADDVAAGRMPRVEYKLPAGWTRNAQPNPMALMSFQAGPADKAAKVNIVPLPGPAGGLLANVNRWRQQTGLEPITIDTLGKTVKKMEIDGTPAWYVELYTPKEAGMQRSGMLGVIAPRGEASWFITMRGPADVVEKQADAFKSFVGSLHIVAAAGERPDSGAPAPDPDSKQ